MGFTREKDVSAGGTVEGLSCLAEYTAEKKLHMKEMYEVLKFIEHGLRCRQSMDCVQGTILLNYLKENPRIDKTVLIDWFRELAVSVDQYHRSHGRQNYRYLNPCSVIVSEDGRLFLLDTEAPDNEPVMKRMQKRAVRSHFVKPVYEIGIGRNNEADLFAYGKTIQFILAYSEIHPALSRREERRLSRVIGRCTGDLGRKYEDLHQVLKDLPPVPRRKADAQKCDAHPGLRKMVISAGTAAVLLICVFARAGEKEEYGQADEAGEHIVKKENRKYMREQNPESEKTGTICAEEAAEKTGLASQELVGFLEKRIITDEMISAYGRVIELEEDKEKIKEAGLKKMKLEMRQENYEQALETAKTVSEKTGGSEKLSELIEGCEKNIP